MNQLARNNRSKQQKFGRLSAAFMALSVCFSSAPSLAENSASSNNSGITNDVTDVLDIVSKAVVQVAVVGPVSAQIQPRATGVVLDSERGHIVTVASALTASDDVVIQYVNDKLETVSVKSRIIASAPAMGVVFLKTEEQALPLQALKPNPLAVSANPSGQMALAVATGFDAEAQFGVGLITEANDEQLNSTACAGPLNAGGAVVSMQGDLLAIQLDGLPNNPCSGNNKGRRYVAISQFVEQLNVLVNLPTGEISNTQVAEPVTEPVTNLPNKPAQQSQPATIAVPEQTTTAPSNVTNDVKTNVQTPTAAPQIPAVEIPASETPEVEKPSVISSTVIPGENAATLALQQSAPQAATALPTEQQQTNPQLAVIEATSTANTTIPTPIEELSIVESIPAEVIQEVDFIEFNITEPASTPTPVVDNSTGNQQTNTAPINIDQTVRNSRQASATTNVATEDTAAPAKPIISKQVTGRLGIHLQDLEQALADRFSASTAEGALVADVIPGSAGMVIGLEPGDIITSFNGQTIKNYQQLKQAVANSEGGQAVELEILRGGIAIIMRGRLSHGGNSVASGATAERMGQLRFSSVESDHPVYGYAEGVVVNGLNQQQPAYGEQGNSGLRNDDVIIAVNGSPVIDAQGLNAVFERNSLPALLSVRRGEHVFLVELP